MFTNFSLDFYFVKTCCCNRLPKHCVKLICCPSCLNPLNEILRKLLKLDLQQSHQIFLFGFDDFRFPSFLDECLSSGLSHVAASSLDTDFLRAVCCYEKIQECIELINLRNVLKGCLLEIEE